MYPRWMAYVFLVMCLVQAQACISTGLHGPVFTFRRRVEGLRQQSLVTGVLGVPAVGSPASMVWERGASLQHAGGHLHSATECVDVHALMPLARMMCTYLARVQQQLQCHLADDTGLHRCRHAMHSLAVHGKLRCTGLCSLLKTDDNMLGNALDFVHCPMVSKLPRRRLPVPKFAYSN